MFEGIDSAETLAVVLGGVSNRRLLEMFRIAFRTLEGITPHKKDYATLDIAKAFIDEFRARIYISDYQALREIALLIQADIKTVSAGNNDFYTKNLLRVYGIAVQRLQKIAGKKGIKKEFL